VRYEPPWSHTRVGDRQAETLWGVSITFDQWHFSQFKAIRKLSLEAKGGQFLYEATDPI
jgi:hypothetical protein